MGAKSEHRVLLTEVARHKIEPTHDRQTNRSFETLVAIGKATVGVTLDLFRSLSLLGEIVAAMWRVIRAPAVSVVRHSSISLSWWVCEACPLLHSSPFSSEESWRSRESFSCANSEQPSL